MSNRLAEPVIQTDTALTGAGTATVATAEGALIASNGTRVEVTICNTDAANPVFLGLGVAAALNSGVQIPAQGSYTTRAFTGAIRAIAKTGAVVVSFVEIG